MGIMRLPHGLSWTRGEPCCVRETAQWSYDALPKAVCGAFSYRIRLYMGTVTDLSSIRLKSLNSIRMFAVWLEMPYDVFMGRIYRAVQPVEKGEYYA